MSDLYAPNQQVVRADGSGPAEEGAGGASPPSAGEPTPLDEMTKDELLAEAERRGVDADASMTKAQIKDAIGGQLAYTTTAELAAKLKVRISPDNEPLLQACIDAAAEEIDHHVDRVEGDPVDPADPLANQVNLARAAEWWKAIDATFGTVGFTDTGILQAPKGAFSRHAGNLTPLRQQWGVG